MKIENLVIEQIKIEKLTPHENNSKIHTPEQIQHIAHSIKEFGFNDPLAVAEKTMLFWKGTAELKRQSCWV